MNRVYNNKCNEHVTEDIVCICVNCDNIPVCFDCFSVGGIHYGHKVNKVQKNEKLILPLVENFQLETMPKLEQFLITTKGAMDTFDNELKELQTKNSTQIDQLKTRFKTIHTRLSTIENDLTRQLETNLDDNLRINEDYRSNFDCTVKMVENIQNISNLYRQDQQQQQEQEQLNEIHIGEKEKDQVYIEILKYNHQFQRLFTEYSNKLVEYKIPQLTENYHTISNIDDLIKSIFSLTTTTATEIQRNIYIQKKQQQQQEQYSKHLRNHNKKYH